MIVGGLAADAWKLATRTERTATLTQARGFVAGAMRLWNEALISTEPGTKVTGRFIKRTLPINVELPLAHRIELGNEAILSAHRGIRALEGSSVDTTTIGSAIGAMERDIVTSRLGSNATNGVDPMRNLEWALGNIDVELLRMSNEDILNGAANVAAAAY